MKPQVKYDNDWWVLTYHDQIVGFRRRYYDTWESAIKALRIYYSWGAVVL